MVGRCERVERKQIIPKQVYYKTISVSWLCHLFLCFCFPSDFYFFVLFVTSSSTFATSTLVSYSLVFIYPSSHDFKVFAQSLNSLSGESLGYYSHK